MICFYNFFLVSTNFLESKLNYNSIFSSIWNQSDEVSLELEDLRDLAKTRLEELEKVNENFITSQQELEKLKLEVLSDLLHLWLKINLGLGHSFHCCINFSGSHVLSLLSITWFFRWTICRKVLFFNQRLINVYSHNFQFFMERLHR